MKHRLASFSSRLSAPTLASCLESACETSHGSYVWALIAREVAPDNMSVSVSYFGDTRPHACGDGIPRRPLGRASLAVRFAALVFVHLVGRLLWLVALLAALHRLINVALSGRRLKPDVRRAQPHGQAVYPRCAYLCTWFHMFAVPICTEPQTVFCPPAYRAVAIPWWVVALPLATSAPLARCCVLPHQCSRVLCGLRLLGAYSVLHRCAVGDAGLGLVVWTLPV